MSNKFLTVLILFLCVTWCAAQTGFKGAAILGFNAAQLDGDNLAGYNKLGLSAGLRVAYPLKEKMDLGMEMLFSQRGSQSKLNLGSSGDLIQTKLNYFEMPVTFTLKDWYIENEKYFRTSIHGGFSAGYLFDVSSSDGLYEGTTGNFKNFDLSFLIGLSYAINKHWTFSLRYTTGLFNIYSNPQTGDDTLRSYFLTFRSEYHF